MKKHLNVVKLASLVLAVLILTLSLASCGSAAVSLEAGTHGALSYSYEGRTLTISGTGDMADFANADSVVWKAVRTGAEKLVLSEGIASVGNYAFYGMSALKEISLPSTLVEIGDCAFAFCSSLEAVSLPQVLTTVGRSAFEGCGKLGSLYLPESVTSVGEKAFASCYSMTDAMIAGEHVTVGALAFKNCRSLQDLLFRDSEDMQIAENAFEGASKNDENATRTDNASGSTTVTVTYVYEDGASAYTTFEQSWTYGVDYRIPSPAIENHTADQTVVEGRADGQPRSVSVTYKLNEVVADTSAETTEPVASEPEAEKPGVGTVIAVVIMVLVLAGIGVGAFLLIRSDKKNAGKNTTTVRKKPDEKAAKNAKKKQNKKQ